MCIRDRGTSTVTTTVEHDLTGASGSGDRTLEGTVITAVKTAADGETETVTTTLTPAVKLSSAQEGEILTGTVALEEMTGKNVTKALTFTFDEEPVQVTDQPEESADMASAAEDGEPVYDPMPQSSLSQNEEPVDGVDSDYLVGQPPIGYQIYEVPDTMQTYDLEMCIRDSFFDTPPSFINGLRSAWAARWRFDCQSATPSSPQKACRGGPRSCPPPA